LVKKKKDLLINQPAKSGSPNSQSAKNTELREKKKVERERK